MSWHIRVTDVLALVTYQIARSPIPGQTRGVREGGVVHRESEVTGEALYRSVQSADSEISRGNSRSNEAVQGGR